MNKYICWYAYSGQETEGALHLGEPFRCKAENESEALWKYLCKEHLGKTTKPYHKNLSEHMKSESNSGGWGYCVVKMHESETYTDDDGYFYK